MPTTCVYSGICRVASSACTPEVATAKNCGFIAAVEAEKGKKVFCHMASQCGCITNGATSCTPEIFIKLGCAYVNGKVSGRVSPTEIFLGQVRQHGGYCVGSNPWYVAVGRLVPNADEFRKAEFTAWTRYVMENFAGRMSLLAA
ncbi:hypothetical protein A3J77_00250 [Candidatus Wolfebacteria bacterium RBG_13_41_7]|uniref:Uncharacterized protein n=1 Tax=Candidatus Wolfebacteria bacterium RBG_13_41_7 TaxID=1802554 RepID=A0A1F8DQW8_9BACT|nr:MAG: hypothetical protein A3J77_00250 [Candidatus Wolfebacteria bacterium RBG_13_41_7]